MADSLLVIAQELKVWNKTTFGNVNHKIKRATKEIESLVKSQPSKTIMTALKNCKRNLNELLQRQEIMWRQRSRVEWLKERDLNTSFFHGRATTRKKKIHISRIKKENGQWTYRDKNIEEVARDYFHTLFATSHPTDVEEALLGVGTKVTEYMNQFLTLPYTALEIKETLFQMASTKAPGQDGPQPYSTKNMLEIAGEDIIIRACLHFLNNGGSLDLINKTFIMLIPKIKSPENLTQFRLISLCNVLYKIAIKVMANRLKVILPHIISKS